MQPNRIFVPFSILLWSGLVVSAIFPFDYFTWILEVFPAIIGFFILFVTRKSFPLSTFLYVLILIHCYVLFVGGHYTYAEVPLFNYIKEIFHQSRNNYDKVGHFMQGFVPALIAREIILRKNILNRKSWMSFICISICLGISALYELLEAFVAICTGDSAEAFLGTQGYVWDTQSDMFLALIGAITALLLFSKWQDRSISHLS